MGFQGSAARHLLVWEAMLFLLVALPARAAKEDEEALSWLTERISALAADRRIAGARVGLLVQDLTSARTLVKMRESEKFNVASCVKIVTASAALKYLGPEYRFKTVLFAPRRRGEVVEGDVYIKGFGDPYLRAGDLWQMARRLHRLGVRRIKGRVVLDETYFDARRDPPLFQDRDTDQYYRSAVSALSLEQNVMQIRVRGGAAPGEPAQILVWPESGYLRVQGSVLTVAPGRRSWVKVSTSPERTCTTVEVSGRVRAGYGARPFRRRIEDPGLMAANAFLDLLRQEGIQVDRPVVQRGTAPPGLHGVAAHYSPPLSVVVRLMIKESNNFVAEQVLKVLGAETAGAPGTWPKGLAAVSRYLAAQQMARGSYIMKNGSGLYDATRFSPGQMVRILRTAYRDFQIGADLLAALPIAGADGTLDHRFQDSGTERYVRAKTGTLRDVVTLAGLAGASTAKKRGPLAFAIFFNELPRGRIRAARAVVDSMAAALVTYLER